MKDYKDLDIEMTIINQWQNEMHNLFYTTSHCCLIYRQSNDRQRSNLSKWAFIYDGEIEN